MCVFVAFRAFLASSVDVSVALSQDVFMRGENERSIVPLEPPDFVRVPLPRLIHAASGEKKHIVLLTSRAGYEQLVVEPSRGARNLFHADPSSKTSRLKNQVVTRVRVQK